MVNDSVLEPGLALNFVGNSGDQASSSSTLGINPSFRTQGLQRRRSLKRPRERGGSPPTKFFFIAKGGETILVGETPHQKNDTKNEQKNKQKRVRRKKAISQRKKRKSKRNRKKEKKKNTPPCQATKKERKKYKKHTHRAQQQPQASGGHRGPATANHQLEAIWGAKEGK
jgi:hypothetical protein